MKESDFLSRVLKDVKYYLEGRGVVFKHNDRITRGIPDASVSYCGRTTWLEAKWLGKKRSYEPKGELLQHETMRRLESSAYAYYLLGYSTGETRFVTALPSQIEDLLIVPGRGSFDADVSYLMEKINF